MSNEQNNTQASWYERVFRGMTVGAAVMLGLTPGLNWTNRTMKNQSFGWKEVFRPGGWRGVKDYVTAGATCFTTAFATKELFKGYFGESGYSPLMASFVSGSMAGLVSTPSEALAQNKLLSNLPSKQVMPTMIKYNGRAALFRGAAAVMTREGIWASVYMTPQPAFWGFVYGAAFGVVSCPLYRLKVAKQSGLTKSQNHVSYPSHIRNMWNEQPNASAARRFAGFFKGGVPRSITAGTGVVMFQTGLQVYDTLRSKMS